jgi:hypothetical protein
MIKKIFIPVIIGLILLSACEEEMDFESEEIADETLVVEGSFTTDTTSHVITLSRTSDFFSVQPKKMEHGATVTISGGGNTIPLEEVAPGVYKTANNVFGVVGETYTLDIVTVTGEVFYATETMPRIVSPDSVTFSENINHLDPSTDWTGYGYEVFYHGPEPRGTGDYYLWNLYIDGVKNNDTIFESTFVDDSFVDGNYISDFPVFMVQDTEMDPDSSLITLETLSISRGYYNFLIGLMLETVWRGSPWDGPPANVETNVKPEGFGYFNVAASHEVNKVLVQSPRVE